MLGCRREEGEDRLLRSAAEWYRGRGSAQPGVYWTRGRYCALKGSVLEHGEGKGETVSRDAVDVWQHQAAVVADAGWKNDTKIGPHDKLRINKGSNTVTIKKINRIAVVFLGMKCK